MPNITRSTNTSERESIFTVPFPNKVSAIKTNSTKAVTIVMYISFRTVSFKNLMGLIIATIAKITHKLNMFVPRILPSAIPSFPDWAPVMATINSGRLVPKETIVTPKIISLIFNIFPILDPESTNQSEPFIKKRIPKC